MKRLIKRLVIIGLLVGGAYLLWGQRHHIAGIQNNNLLVQGTWYVYELDRKGLDPYVFSEGIITRDGVEWGTYKVISNEQIEVMVERRLDTYHLGFRDEDTMVWSTEVKGDLLPAKIWHR